MHPSAAAGASAAETYLRARGIVGGGDTGALRFNLRCYYRTEAGNTDRQRESWPASITAVTDRQGTITGVQRTYLDPSDQDKAPGATPRRALGHLLGHAVRFGAAENVMAVGEGIETVLSLRSALPSLPAAAALSAGHLTANAAAEHLAEMLRLSDFVVMRGPPARAPQAPPPPHAHSHDQARFEEPDQPD